MLMQAVDTYLAIRRAADFKLDAAERYVRSFAQFATAQGDTHVVTQTAIMWAEQGASEPQRHNRLSVVIRFARFSHAEDPRHDIPPARVFYGHRQRPTPYLFSEEDIQAVLAQAARLGPPGSLRPHTYSTLLALLAVTGLRPSEALALRFKDVTPDGTVVDTFHQLLAAAGLPAEPHRRRPRLMDFRHTFASRALETCPEGRDNIGRHMLALTTYMGHARVKSTYYYLERTPQLMGDIAQACEALVREETS